MKQMSSKQPRINFYHRIYYQQCLRIIKPRVNWSLYCGMFQYSGSESCIEVYKKQPYNLFCKFDQIADFYQFCPQVQELNDSLNNFTFSSSLVSTQDKCVYLYGLWFGIHRKFQNIRNPLYHYPCDEEYLLRKYKFNFLLTQLATLLCKKIIDIQNFDLFEYFLYFDLDIDYHPDFFIYYVEWNEILGYLSIQNNSTYLSYLLLEVFAATDDFQSHDVTSSCKVAAQHCRYECLQLYFAYDKPNLIKYMTQACIGAIESNQIECLQFILNQPYSAITYEVFKACTKHKAIECLQLLIQPQNIIIDYNDKKSLLYADCLYWCLKCLVSESDESQQSQQIEQSRECLLLLIAYNMYISKTYTDHKMYFAKSLLVALKKQIIVLSFDQLFIFCIELKKYFVLLYKNDYAWFLQTYPDFLQQYKSGFI